MQAVLCRSHFAQNPLCSLVSVRARLTSSLISEYSAAHYRPMHVYSGYSLCSVAVSKIPGYQRTTKYKLLYARTNAQSRALKGLPTTNEPAPEPPTWQALHEFTQAVDPSVIDSLQPSEGSKKVLANAKQSEFSIFELRKAHGAKKFFD